MGTFRIFIAPVLDENNQQLPFEEQRRLMIELDKFSQASTYYSVEFIYYCFLVWDKRYLIL